MFDIPRLEAAMEAYLQTIGNKLTRLSARIIISGFIEFLKTLTPDRFN